MILRKIPAVLLVLVPLFCAAAFEWPVSKVQPVSIFGQKASPSIECGIVLEQADIVRAAGNGTVLMVLEADPVKTGFPGTLGNALLLSHDEGLVTVYGNLASLDRIDRQTTFETGAIIGEAGKTALTAEGNTIFQVIDQVRRLYLNPLLLLPAQTDSRRPVINSATLTGNNGKMHPLASIRSIRQGKYSLHAEISDTVDGVNNELAPFRITIMLNGSEYAGIPFEIIRSESGKLHLGSAGQGVSQVYNETGLLSLGDISLPRGKNDISIIARDITGNERISSWTITAD